MGGQIGAARVQHRRDQQREFVALGFAPVRQPALQIRRNAAAATSATPLVISNPLSKGRTR
jgi:hypothetical protein